MNDFALSAGPSAWPPPVTSRLASERFTLEVEMVALVGRGKFRYRELPIHYRPRTYAVEGDASSAAERHI